MISLLLSVCAVFIAFAALLDVFRWLFLRFLICLEPCKALFIMTWDSMPSWEDIDRINRCCSSNHVFVQDKVCRMFSQCVGGSINFCFPICGLWGAWVFQKRFFSSLLAFHMAGPAA
jgi:hypothetical protein